MKKVALRNQEVHINDVNFEKLMLVYSIALTKIKNVIGELTEKINNEDGHNVVTNISSRIKNPDSIIDKMIKIFNRKY